jgi:hypothetical protein
LKNLDFSTLNCSKIGCKRDKEVQFFAFESRYPRQSF